MPPSSTLASRCLAGVPYVLPKSLHLFHWLRMPSFLLPFSGERRSLFFQDRFLQLWTALSCFTAPSVACCSVSSESSQKKKRPMDCVSLLLTYLQWLAIGFAIGSKSLTGHSLSFTAWHQSRCIFQHRTILQPLLLRCIWAIYFSHARCVFCLYITWDISALFLSLELLQGLRLPLLVLCLS